MLDVLNDARVGAYSLSVEYIAKTRFFDQRHIELYLRDVAGNRSDVPVVRGLYNAGRPSIYVPAWFDGEFVENVTINRRGIDLAAGLADEIAQKLGELVPPGGRLWIAYEAFEGEGELARETRAALIARVPLVTTPIGFLLYRANCWVGIRDWDIPEGGREGPRKLQGNKALGGDHARQRASELVLLLQKFIKQAPEGNIQSRAQDRARSILPGLIPWL